MLITGLRREDVEQVAERLGLGGRGRLPGAADVAEELGEFVKRTAEHGVDTEGGGERPWRRQRATVGQLLPRVVEHKAEAHLLARRQPTVGYVLPNIRVT